MTSYHAVTLFFFVVMWTILGIFLWALSAYAEYLDIGDFHPWELFAQ